MLLGEQMANFLERDPNLALIDFHLEGLHVSGRDLARVGAALRDGRIIVIIDANLGSNCVYAKDTDAMCVPPEVDLRDPIFKAALVHEAVHGSCDMKRCVSTSPLSEEVAGYLAQVIYTRRISARSGTIIGSNASERALFDAANQVVNRKSLDVLRGVHLSFGDYAELRQVISRHPLYFHMASAKRAPANNGIRPRV